MMPNRRVIILIAVILFLNLTLAIIFRDFIRENVLIPILYLFWYVRLFLNSLGEVCLWPLALIILVVISLFILRKNKKSVQSDPGYSDASALIEDGRVAFWMKYIRRQSMGVENLNFSSFRMKELILSVLAYQENLTNAELESEIDQGRIKIPEALLSIVQSQERVIKPTARSASFINNVLKWLRFKTDPLQSTESSEMGKLVRYLETLLEIEHDDGNI